MPSRLIWRPRQTRQPVRLGGRDAGARRTVRRGQSARRCLLLTQVRSDSLGHLFALYAALTPSVCSVAWKHLPETWQQDASTALRRDQLHQLKSLLSNVSHPRLFVLDFNRAVHFDRECRPVANPHPVLAREHDANFPFVLALAYFPSAIVFSFFQSRLGKLADRVGRRMPIAMGLIVSGLSSTIVPNLASFRSIIGEWALLPLVGSGSAKQSVSVRPRLPNKPWWPI